ncbi:MAG: chemotaxis protein CheD [Elusimicrobia bacterium]|nr:chemotaxis protein CheD [Candidatus Obscuribacterium magneticum]
MIEVPMGELQAVDNRDVLTASGVGSCLVITFYDQQRNCGALAHALISRRSSGGAVQKRRARYVEDAIEESIKSLAAFGSTPRDLVAKLAGGANMFPALGPDIGAENVSAAKEALNRAGVAIVGESTGGNIGRSVEFQTDSGVVTIKIKF